MRLYVLALIALARELAEREATDAEMQATTPAEPGEEARHASA